MLGAIIGDIVGSRYESRNTKVKTFPLFDQRCRFTDDTVLTAAIAEALLVSKRPSDVGRNAVLCMRRLGRAYPRAGYGGMFRGWLGSPDPKPYNSYGNGAAMRISPVGFWARTEEEVKTLSAAVTEVTHNHPEAIKGAEAVAMAIFLARKKWDKEDIFRRIARDYYPAIETPEYAYSALKEVYDWYFGIGSVTCQCSVPQAIVCFHESEGFEDAIRTAIALGGDSDTIGAMVGGIAEAYYGIPTSIETAAQLYLTEELRAIVADFREAMAERTV